MKTANLIIALLICINTAQAIEMCDSSLTIYTNCTMITPTMNCTVYNYTIINITGSVIEQGNLTKLYEDIYYLNFTLSKGDYLIELCDGTTREVVVEDGNMWYTAVAIILAVGIWFFGRMIYDLEDEHIILKYLAMIVVIWIIVGGMGLGLSMAENNTTNQSIIMGISTGYKAFLWAAITISSYLLIYAGVYIPMKMYKNKKWKDEES